MRKIIVFLLFLCLCLNSGAQQKEETLLPAPRQLPVEIILENAADFYFTWLAPKEREIFPALPNKEDIIYVSNGIYDWLLPYLNEEQRLLFRPRREKNPGEQNLWQIEKQKKELLELLDDIEEARSNLERDLRDYQFQLGLDKIRFESDLMQSWIKAKSIIEGDIWMDRWLSMAFPKTYHRKFNRTYLDYALLYYFFLINPRFK